jgi:osmotically-inducible protein OsmY
MMARPAVRVSELMLVSVCIAVGLLNPPTRSGDSLLKQQVLTRLAGDPAITGLNLDVTVSGRVATVAGQFEDPAQARLVLTTVSSTPGVMDVIEDLRVSDDVIRRTVIRALESDPIVGNVPVTVRCVNGEVTLQSDRTNDDQRKRLVRLAAGVTGVVHVVDAMK